MQMGWMVGAPTLLLAGCVGPFDLDDFMEFVPPEALVREIDSLGLEDRSRTDPVTIDEATRRIAEETVDTLLREKFARDAALPSMDLMLEEVRAQTLRTNLDLQVELISPSISATSVDEEEAKFEATFTASFARSRTDTATALTTESSKQTFTRYDAGVQIPLRTGGTATVSFPISENDSDNAFSTLNPAYNTDVRFSLSQPLLRNAGNRVNTYSIRVAKYEDEMTRARTKLEAIRILANADRAYWRLYAAQRELEVRQQQYELAVAQRERAQRRFDAGDVPEIEVVRAESGIAQRLEGIIVADNLVRRTRRDLKRIMNREDLPMGSATRFVLATAPDPVGLDLDAESLIEYALANRMEMLELELQLALDASSIDFARNQKLPLVTLDYAYNVNGLGRTYNEALGQIADRSFEDWSVGLSADIPIGNEAAKAQYHAAILQRIQRLATRDRRVSAIQQEVYDAIDQIQQNWQRILAARQDVILAGRTLDGEQRQFDVGARTSTDVLDAATNLADAQSSEILALTDYQISQIDLAFATGTLLGYGKVRWDPVEYEGGD